MSSSDLWLMEYEAIHDRVGSGELEGPDDVRRELRSLGFNAQEIEEELDMLRDDYPDELKESSND